MTTKSAVNNYLKIFRVRSMVAYDGSRGEPHTPPEERFVFFDDTRVANVVRAYALARNHAIHFEGKGVDYRMSVYAECDGLPPEIPEIGRFPNSIPAPPDSAA